MFLKTHNSSATAAHTLDAPPMRLAEKSPNSQSSRRGDCCRTLVALISSKYNNIIFVTNSQHTSTHTLRDTRLHALVTVSYRTVRRRWLWQQIFGIRYVCVYIYLLLISRLFRSNPAQVTHGNTTRTWCFHERTNELPVPMYRTARCLGSTRRSAVARCYPRDFWFNFGLQRRWFVCEYLEHHCHWLNIIFSTLHRRTVDTETFHNH